MRKIHVVPTLAAPTPPIETPEGIDEAPVADVAQPAFDERFGIKIGRRTYYINVRIGAELRSKERLAQDGQVRVSGLAFIYCVVCSAAIMLFGTLCIIYLLKSGIGINLTDGDSILHPLYSIARGE